MLISTLYGMSRIQAITSAANPLLREVRRAIARGERTADGLCVAEGFHLLEEALRSGRDVPAVLTSESVRETVDRQVRGLAATRTVVLPDALFQSIASTEASQGVMALVRPAEWSMEQVFRGSSLVVVLDGLQDPGNAGAIVRAAEAFGATGVLFLKGTAGPYHPKTLRASAGSLFRVPFVAGLDAALARATLRQHRVAVYAAMPYTGAQKLAGATDFVRRCAIVAGSEGRGVSKELHGIAEEVAIPTTGVESLNAAVAASVLLYEARRQRQEADRAPLLQSVRAQAIRS
jgi:TrmH family RNA methyltransferase